VLAASLVDCSDALEVSSVLNFSTSFGDSVIPGTDQPNASAEIADSALFFLSEQLPQSRHFPATPAASGATLAFLLSGEAIRCSDSAIASAKGGTSPAMHFGNSAPFAVSTLLRGSGAPPLTALWTQSATLVVSAALLGKGTFPVAVAVGVGSALFAIACGAGLLLWRRRNRNETGQLSEVEFGEFPGDFPPRTMAIEIFSRSDGVLWEDAPAPSLWE
jgi:hypothetical protein